MVVAATYALFILSIVALRLGRDALHDDARSLAGTYGVRVGGCGLVVSVFMLLAITFAVSDEIAFTIGGDSTCYQNSDFGNKIRSRQCAGSHARRASHEASDPR